jgi:prolipoprotein diacylglyceryltransferase
MIAPPATIRLCGRQRCAFHVWGVAGYGAAAVLSIVLGTRAGLVVWMVPLLLLLAAAVFLALALATKIALGDECLIYYHHEIAVLACCAAIAHLVGSPVLTCLDVGAAGLGAFLAFGRLGCASVGCCYGRPSARGLVYGPAHAQAGFPAHLCGVRLVPVQWVESLLVALLTVAASVLIWRRAPAGAAFAVYAGGYALLRFTLEFFRGDDGRGYLGGFSTAQWTSVAVWIAITFRAPLLLPILPAALLAARLHRRRAGPCARLFEARHVHELAGLLAVAHRGGGPLIFRTSGGMLLSAGCESVGGQAVEHYTLSSAAHPIPTGPALRMARLLAQLRGRSRFEGSLVHGRQGVIHVVLSARSSRIRYAR